MKSKLLDLMQKEIDNEQQPKYREKPLSKGLLKAMEIIKDYQEKNACDYEYLSSGVWLEVKDKEQLILIENLGFLTRRKNVN